MLRFLQLYLIFFSFIALHAQSSDISGIVNTYYPVDSTWKQSCFSFVKVSDATGLVPGDEVLVIQMQGARIVTENQALFGNITGYYNAGNFEFARISAITGNIITFQSYLQYYYDAPGKVQLIKVPHYINARVTGLLGAAPWNGSTGGVLAIDVQDTLNMLTDIDVSGTGFRGGNPYPSQPRRCDDGNYVWSLGLGGIGPKGEGIWRQTITAEAGIGSPANGGGSGNAQNSGGGGGSNAGMGGMGGTESSDCPAGLFGGNGGYILNLYDDSKVFMGGGGGAGQQDDNLSSPGASGGGIVIIRASVLIGNGHSISAKGSGQFMDAGNGIVSDGAGGGGGGGSILLDVNSYSNALILNAGGGKGGNTFANDALICNGPGGGGGGGLIRCNRDSLPFFVTTNITEGTAGFVINSLSPCGGTTYGALDGTTGQIQYRWHWPLNTHPLPEISSLSPDTMICENDSIQISVTPGAGGPYTVQWTPTDHIRNSNSERPIIYPLTSRYYSVTLTDTAGCSVSDSLLVMVNPLPDPGLDRQYTLLLGNSLSLDVNAGDSIYWAPFKGIDSIHSFHPVFTPDRSTLYRYYIVDSNGCQYRDSLYMLIKQCTDLDIPNIFTPNGDGVNDNFTINRILIEKMIKLVIFNRWGEKVFESQDIHSTWNGTYNGNPLPMDSYTWVLTGICDGAEFTESGNVTLVR